ncbi:hypothetical protein Vadar_007182 [Vaccinium darrowii]|uniref:Uncharacterized protein n=1 Tax=Vaccinium darrowii TaxID=229202 RepID=A0ACB7X853_9ERIC|nr:hypothetical protein Vadar_007182 [Vaccinium darrowii]
MDRNDPRWKGKGIVESSARPTGRLGHIIPGPAGLVQMAMERRAAREGHDESMNTQEFIHRALAVESADTDFVDNFAWLTAVRQGYLKHPEYTDLATVNNMRVTTARIPLIVALVKSCKRNELGEPWLELKDPSGSIWAGIHHKAYEQDLFPGILDPGTCLILKKIVVWRPEKKPYLNITLNNLQCVIEKSVLD